MRKLILAWDVFVFVGLLGVFPGISLPGFNKKADAALAVQPTKPWSNLAVITLAAHGQFGVRLVDLTDAQRRRLERNTGAVVVKVYSETPAFYANILVDDVVIAVNGRPVGTAADAVAKLRALDHDAGPAKITIIRRGETKTITVAFK